MNKPLLHKTALVTGASRGIGAAIAKRLAADGAEVILHFGSGAAEAQAVAAEIRAAGGKASTVQADLAAADGPAKLAAAVTTPTVDILVNNAGVALFAGIDAMSEAEFDRQANINMRSLFFITQKFLPRIPAGGRIINVASAVTRIAFPGIPAYAATKGFVDVLTLQLAAELGKRNITVNAVAPGAIDTQMSAWVRTPEGEQTVAQIQALPGIGQPAHVAGVVGFLAGPDGAWTTGQIVDVSGGTKL
ncbi:SDR family NAD(P)-dependent oxidoreductase [Piscinibacterium candidicorallinum]|jgi:NAD(P)-dependent dehydrogenase (short-subunit alcohol dehydrogenase family)|uniref:SDR family NAD(P)-dependent oxidoreductase n=1 Tax=Piscinibacterium candidicorallinum TaxID=1793872 RepID=A0ABV7H1J4_9BURK